MYRFRLPRVGWSLLAVVTLAVAALAGGIVFAYCRCFSRFVAYDDQGSLMLNLQHVLEGWPHYEHPWVDKYGPWHYMTRWVPHGLLGIPLTTDNVRLLSVLVQLVSSLLLGLAVLVVQAGRSGRWLLAVACFVLCVLHLHVFANEPGHPQEMIVLSLSACVLAVAVYATRPFMLCLVVGITAGIILLCKANVGVFFAVGAALALGRHMPPTLLWIALRRASLLVALLLPFGLMYRHLTDPTYLALAVIAASAVVSSWLTARRIVPQGDWQPRSILGAILGLAASVAIGFVCGGWLGSRIGPMLHSVFLAPVSFTNAIFRHPLPWRTPQMLVAIAALVAAALVARSAPNRWPAWAVGGLKLLLGTLVLWHDPTATAVWGPALLWVALVPPPGRTFTRGECVWREFICFVAALQVLQIFPVPGSQISVGTVLLVPIGMLCLADIAESWERAWSGRTWAAAPGAAIALVAVACGWHAAHAEWRHYHAGIPLHAAGARRLRLPERNVAHYEWLMDNVRQSPETFLCVTGPHSLYPWTGRRSPTPVIDLAMSPALQRDVLTLYTSRPDLLVVDFDKDSPASSVKMPTTFYREFFATYVPLGRAARWTLYTHRDSRRSWRLVGCSYSTPAVQALLDDIMAAALATYAPLPPVLSLVLTDAQAAAGVAALQVVDLKTNAILADSRDPQRPASLLDEHGTRLIPAPGDEAPELDALAWHALRVELGALPRKPPGFPALRLLDAQGRRLFTLPIAMSRTEAEPDPDG